MEPNMQSHLSIFNPSFCMVSFYLLPTSCMTSSSYIYSISHPHYSVLQLTKTFVVETSCCVINLLRHLLKKSVLIQKCEFVDLLPDSCERPSTHTTSGAVPMTKVYSLRISINKKHIIELWKCPQVVLWKALKIFMWEPPLMASSTVIAVDEEFLR